MCYDNKSKINKKLFITTNKKGNDTFIVKFLFI